MSDFRQHMQAKRGLLIVIGLVIVFGSLLLTAFAAPAVANRFTGTWGLIATAELDSSILRIRLERQARHEEELRAAQEAAEKKEKISRRGISRATIKDHVPATGKFIGIDLVEMKTTLFENGKELESFAVLSKGRPASHWETPSGSYTIRTKEESHFSTIGHVYMPWSMQFFGNFFIHGWPTHEDGTPVPEGYSGGCVRLATDDAEKVFAFARAGTPIFIYDTDALPDEPVPPLLLGEYPEPEIDAEAYLVADLDGGEILLEKNAATPSSIASITKLMTAIVANETISFDKKIGLVDPPSGEEQGGTIFPVGERFEIGLLYHPLLTESSNQAAVSIAEYYGTDRFVRTMNEKAKALGMRKTVFTDATGLDPGNVSTADDLLLLANHLREKKRFLLNITKTTTKTILSQEEVPYDIGNTMSFAGEKSFIGGKTGFTNAAHETGVFLFRVGEGDDVRAVAVIVLGSEKRQDDVMALRGWLDGAIAEGLSENQKTASSR